MTQADESPFRSHGVVSEPYTDLADAYVAGAERTFSERMAAFALARADHHAAAPIRRVADVACGMGAACVVFAQRGLDVVGADRSDEMIRRAEAVAAAAGVEARLLVQDYRELRIEPPVDLVTCMYDSLNFMTTEAELRRAFQSVRGCMVEGGVFVFDMYTVRGLAETWGTRAEIHTVTEDHFVASQTAWRYETSSNTKVLYGFSRRPDGQWHRWEERHSMVAYPLARLRECLEAAGFAVREAIDWDDSQHGPASEQTQRVVVVAQAVG